MATQNYQQSTKQGWRDLYRLKMMAYHHKKPVKEGNFLKMLILKGI